MRQRWPGLTAEGGERGAHMASEILASILAENTATHQVMEAAVVNRLAAATVMDCGKAEFRDIAAGAGMSLDAMRDAMQAIQRGEPPVMRA